MKNKRPTLADWQKKLQQANIPFEGVPAVKEKKKRASEEYHLQVACMNYFTLAYPEYDNIFHHIPNQAVINDARIGALLKRMGRKRGVLDCFLPVARNGYNGLYIDFKSKDGVLSVEQEDFIVSVTAEGYLCRTIDNREDFIQLIESYLGKSKRINY